MEKYFNSPESLKTADKIIKEHGTLRPPLRVSVGVREDLEILDVEEPTRENLASLSVEDVARLAANMRIRRIAMSPLGRWRSWAVSGNMRHKYYAQILRQLNEGKSPEEVLREHGILSPGSTPTQRAVRAARRARRA